MRCGTVRPAAAAIVLLLSSFASSSSSSATRRGRDLRDAPRSTRRFRRVETSDPRSITTTTTTRRDDVHAKKDVVVVSSSSSSSFWPPWPLNNVGRRRRRRNDRDDGSGDRSSDDDSSSFAYRDEATLLLRYLRERARLGVYQAQQVASEASFHLPPSAATVALLAVVPIRRADGTVRWLNAAARRTCRLSLGASALSWAHHEIRRKKRLAPLPLPRVARGDHVLPPFLPERPATIVVGSSTTTTTLTTNATTTPTIATTTTIAGTDTNHSEASAPRWTRRLREAYDDAATALRKRTSVLTLETTVKQFRDVRRSRRRDVEEAKRNRIMEELIALRTLEKRDESRRRRRRGGRGEGDEDDSSSSSSSSSPPLGHALVTGASKGVGRAIAIELARRGVPLILVARDEERLTRLADDVEACYGVSCHCVAADLSSLDAPRRLFDTTRKAGLVVDVLVNNAGVCRRGDLCDDDHDNEPHDDVVLNVLSTTEIARLYGGEMRRRRRGRVLFVSSVVGALPAGPGVAAYAAAKSYQRVLAASMSKELEPYGVGVTCLLPGAVRDTNLGVDDAACYRLPFYAREPSEVASRGVRAMLAADEERLDGWQNRALVRILHPLLPRRLTAGVVEAAFRPLPRLWPSPSTTTTTTTIGGEERKTTTPPRVLEMKQRNEASAEESETSVERALERYSASNQAEDSAVAEQEGVNEDACHDNDNAVTLDGNKVFDDVTDSVEE